MLILRNQHFAIFGDANSIKCGSVNHKCENMGHFFNKMDQIHLAPILKFSMVHIVLYLDDSIKTKKFSPPHHHPRRSSLKNVS